MARAASSALARSRCIKRHFRSSLSQLVCGRHILHGRNGLLKGLIVHLREANLHCFGVGVGPIIGREVCIEKLYRSMQCVRRVQTELVITASPFEHGLVELLFLIFAIAGVILGLLMILQSIVHTIQKAAIVRLRGTAPGHSEAENSRV